MGAVDARSRRPRMPCQTDPAVPPSWLFREAGPADGTGCRDPEDDALVASAGAAAGQPPPPAWMEGHGQGVVHSLQLRGQRMCPTDRLTRES